MLQQTQVDRVRPKYFSFLERFPDVTKLSAAPLSEVVRAWQGLGYNRRARFLHQTAREIVEVRKGVFPTATSELQKLPGIGPYTAAAVCCFSYNQPQLMIETNVRAVFLYHFFPTEERVSDAELGPIIAAHMDQEQPRVWYWALMDYGSMLKKVMPNPSRKSRSYSKQSTFAGSMRQARGEILRLLSAKSHPSESELRQLYQANPSHFSTALHALAQEQMIVIENGTIRLA